MQPMQYLIIQVYSNTSVLSTSPVRASPPSAQLESILLGLQLIGKEEACIQVHSVATWPGSSGDLHLSIAESGRLH